MNTHSTVVRKGIKVVLDLEDSDVDSDSKADDDSVVWPDYGFIGRGVLAEDKAVEK